MTGDGGGRGGLTTLMDIDCRSTFLPACSAGGTDVGCHARFGFKFGSDPVPMPFNEHTRDGRGQRVELTTLVIFPSRFLSSFQSQGIQSNGRETDLVLRSFSTFCKIRSVIHLTWAWSRSVGRATEGGSVSSNSSLGWP